MTKLTSLSEAVGTIPSGSHVALSGFSIARCAMAFAREVIRRQIKGLTLSQCVGGMDTDILVGTGAADRLIYGGGSLDRFGFLAWVNAGIENGTLTFIKPDGLCYGVTCWHVIEALHNRNTHLGD